MPPLPEAHDPGGGALMTPSAALSSWPARPYFRRFKWLACNEERSKPLIGDIMAEDELPKWSPLRRDLDSRPTPADFRLGGGYLGSGAELDESESSATIETERRTLRTAETNPEATQNLRRPEQKPTQMPLDRMATLIQNLTYGEMMELSEAIWAGSREGSAVTQENLPVLLYCWSITRSARNS